jgi:hypothetical protein
MVIAMRALFINNTLELNAIVAVQLLADVTTDAILAHLMSLVSATLFHVLWGIVSVAATAFDKAVGLFFRGRFFQCGLNIKEKGGIRHRYTLLRAAALDKYFDVIRHWRKGDLDFGHDAIGIVADLDTVMDGLDLMEELHSIREMKVAVL